MIAENPLAVRELYHVGVFLKLQRLVFGTCTIARAQLSAYLVTCIQTQHLAHPVSTRLDSKIGKIGCQKTATPTWEATQKRGLDPQFRKIPRLRCYRLDEARARPIDTRGGRPRCMHRSIDPDSW